MDHEHKIELPLPHHVEVSELLHYLLGELGCDTWYVACHHERLFVFRLTKELRDRYAVRVECNAPVEKGVYHGARAWSVAISPLHNQADLIGGLNRKRLEEGLAKLT